MAEPEQPTVAEEPGRPSEREPAAAIVPVEGGLALPEARRKLNLVLARSALLAGLCRFVPIPLLDDYLEQNVIRFMVASLLKLERRGYHVTHVEPIYGGVGDWLSGVVGWLVFLPFRLLLKLLKKAFKSIFVVMLVREAALSMSSALLLGHVLHRHLRRGELRGRPDDPIAAALLTEAAIFRKAFDAAFKGTDLRMLTHLLGTVFSQVKALRRGGGRVVRAMFGRRYEASDEPGAMPERSRPAVEQGVREIQEAMDQELVKGFLGEFEVTFEGALEHQRRLARQAEEGGSSAGPLG